MTSISERKHDERQALERDVQAFLEKGGQVEQLPMHATNDSRLLSEWDAKISRMRSKHKKGGTAGKETQATTERQSTSVQ